MAPLAPKRQKKHLADRLDEPFVPTENALNIAVTHSARKGSAQPWRFFYLRSDLPAFKGLDDANAVTDTYCTTLPSQGHSVDLCLGRKNRLRGGFFISGGEQSQFLLEPSLLSMATPNPSDLFSNTGYLASNTGHLTPNTGDLTPNTSDLLGTGVGFSQAPFEQYLSAGAP